MKTIVIDVDGVACDHASAICNQLNKDFGLLVTRESVTSWNHNFGPITFTEAVEKYYVDKNFILAIKPTEGIIDFINLVRNNFIVSFATARESVAHDATKEWIKMYFGIENINFIKPKALIDPIHFLIDDSLKEITAAQTVAEKCFLFEQPWNISGKTGKEYPNIINVKDFKQVYELIYD